MIFELILAFILGIIAGTFTGLLPGIHINLVSALVISYLVSLLSIFPAISIAIFIVSLSITHTFIDFIPSIFLGAPDESALSVLPGHKLLLEGKAYEAVIYTTVGCLISLPLLLILTPFFIFLLPKIFFYLKFVMFIILLSVSIYMITTNKNKFLALIVFLLSGFLGISTLFININQPLLPLLSGLFGASSLLSSIRKKEKLPPQSLSKPKIDSSDIKSTFFTSLISSPLCSFLPALGSSQAAIIGTNIQSQENNQKNNQKRFLMLLGSVNLLVISLSFVTVYVIEKARTGSAVAIQEILNNFNFSDLAIIIITILLTSLFAFFLTLKIAKIFSKNISRINYTLLSIIILSFLSIIILYFSCIAGFLLYVVSTFTGLFAIESETRRTNLMGCLMLPSILLYLPI
ncbi:MAG: tripartite tricarboxylate transporter permease [Nanoarchaeota archaeon]